MDQKVLLEEYDKKKKTHYDDITAFIDYIRNKIEDRREIINSIKDKDVLKNIKKNLEQDNKKIIDMIDEAITHIETHTTTL